ncbi:MAG: hypothetical protein QM582_16425 [Micropruina sp.]|uniref:hypothetical protein n=1 Tax=Micropruina sp. TaxID=2737536 RepID=UPI0039E58E8B
MRAPGRPFVDLCGRLLLGVIGWGMLPIGLLGTFMMALDEDAHSHDGSYGLTVACIGIVALVAAAIGGALARWAMGCLGLALPVQATMIFLDSATRPAALDRLSAVVVATVALVGVLATGTAAFQLVGRRPPPTPRTQKE